MLLEIIMFSQGFFINLPIPNVGIEWNDDSEVAEESGK